MLFKKMGRAGIGLGISFLLIAGAASGEEKGSKGAGVVPAPAPAPKPAAPAGINWSTYVQVATEVSGDAAREWISNAQVRGARCEGPIAILPAGSLQSTGVMAESIQAKMVARGIPANVATATGNAIGHAWAAWASGYESRMPLAFPPFAAYPFPAAPVHPAPPHPLRLGGSRGEAGIGAVPLTVAIKTALAIPASDQAADQAITAFTAAFALRFRTWHGLALIQNLLGGGPSKLAPLPGPIFGTVQGTRVLGGPHQF
jgi:hypothetical protein